MQFIDATSPALALTPAAIAWLLGARPLVSQSVRVGPDGCTIRVVV
ncbi:hypothetical protein GCM10027030_12010 [Luteococcus sediminum]